MHASEEVNITVITFLAMIWHIYNDSIFLLEALHYLVYNRVVVKQGVIVIGHHLSFFLREPLALVVVDGEVFLRLRNS